MFEKRPVNRVARIATSTYPRVARSVETLAEDRSWFDGTRESILRRQERVSSVIQQVRAYMATEDENSRLAQAQVWLSTLESEKESLRDVAREYIEAEYQDEIQRLPQYSMMAAGGTRSRLGEYHRNAGRRQSSGDRPTLSRNWQRFCEVEPQFFVRNNMTAVASAAEMRTRAVDHVVAATEGLPDDRFRAEIVDRFVTAVERVRRQASVPKTAKVEKQALDMSSVSDDLLFG